MNETLISRVRHTVVRRLVSAGVDRIALWTFGWFAAWTLYILVRLLVPSVFLGSPFAVALFGIGLYVGLVSLSILRKTAAQAQNSARVLQLVNLSYGVFGLGFLAIIIGAVLWIIDFIRTS